MKCELQQNNRFIQVMGLRRYFKIRQIKECESSKHHGHTYKKKYLANVNSMFSQEIYIHENFTKMLTKLCLNETLGKNQVMMRNSQLIQGITLKTCFGEFVTWEVSNSTQYKMK